MDIGKEKEKIVVEPLKDPVPGKQQPAPQPSKSPQQPQPVKSS